MLNRRTLEDCALLNSHRALCIVFFSGNILIYFETLNMVKHYKASRIYTIMPFLAANLQNQ